MSQDGDSEALAIFNDVQKKKEQEQSQNEGDQEQEHRAHKRIKKHHKDKHKKKKRHTVEYDDQEEEEEDERAEFRDYLDEEADQDDEEQESVIDSDAQFQNQEDRLRYEQLYKTKKPRRTEEFLKRFEDKDGEQINKIYHQKANKRRQNQEMLPSEYDHRMFIVSCKQGKQEEMAFCILNKAAYFNRTGDPKNKVRITSVLALKKKYPAKLFIEAASEKEVREALEGFIDVNSKKITPMDNESYSTLFQNKEDPISQFKERNYVRITKGVYQDDLGQIYKMKKNTVDVLLVPRINVQDVVMKMKEACQKIPDQKLKMEKKEEILKKYTSPRTYYPPQLRPPKKLLYHHHFNDFNDLPSSKQIKLSQQGLIILSFKIDEIKKPQGTCLPIELQPFSKNGRLLEDFQDQEDRRNLLSVVSFSKGDQAEIVAGELTGCFGTVVEIRQNTISLKCKNKDMRDKVIEEHVDHLSKRFKEGQRVKVVSGSNKGKTGLILKVQGRNAEIWTDNQNSITVNKNNLQLFQGQANSQQNVLGLKKDDLIKTTKNGIGIVLETNKDNLKILDTNNIVQLISNLDYQTKINTKNLVTKNKSGDIIKAQTIVRIKKGINEGKRCQVRHVYRDFIFLFSSQLDKTGGITVEKADNCLVIAKTSDFFGRNTTGKPAFGQPAEDDNLTVGRPITISSGPLKGYRGVIKSITKERIQVRVPQKNCTEWIDREKLAQQEQNNQIGRTPRRNAAMTTMYAQSPF